jgi:prepilin-type processing-associated H-X9-DG protein
LLVVVAIIAVLAGLLLPALAGAKRRAVTTACRSNLHQMAVAWEMYLGDHAERFPDRRDLKTGLPGGYKPWVTWPKSDPRSGWAPVTLAVELAAANAWQCPATRRQEWASLPPIWQLSGTGSNAVVTSYWMWRFDRPDDPVALDNFWGKTRVQAVTDVSAANNPQVGAVNGPGEVEFVTDVYFPATAPAVDPVAAGRAPHLRGRNRLYLDGHAAWWRDDRLR